MDPKEKISETETKKMHNVQGFSSPDSTTPKEGSIIELLRFVIIAILIVVPIRVFIAQPFIVSGNSMIPTFSNGDYLIVDEISYRLREPHRGEVVVFRYPEEPSKFFIKRIVGIPEDVLELRAGNVYIDGELYDEPYIDVSTFSNAFLREGTSYTIKEGEYIVFGDNRKASSDSRTWGILPEENIIGRAWLRAMPVKSFTLLPGNYDSKKYAQEIEE